MKFLIFQILNLLAFLILRYITIEVLWVFWGINTKATYAWHFFPALGLQAYLIIGTVTSHKLVNIFTALFALGIVLIFFVLIQTGQISESRLR